MAEEFLTDDEQLEEVKRWTKENGPWLVGGVLIGAVLFFGYRYYEGYRNERALKAGAQFSQMTSAVQANDHAKSRQLADGLIKEYPGSPYADQAQLTLARLDVDDNQLGAAALPLTQVMNQSKDLELRQIARLRLARILIDQGKADEAIRTLAEGTPGAFAGRYHEVRGDALYMKKDTAGAISEYQAALSSGDAGGMDGALLELKIADLGSSGKSAEKPADKLTDNLNKAKP